MTASARVALVHPWLVGLAGSERVLLAFTKAFPDAPIYTSVYDPDRVSAFADRDVRTSFLQRWPLARRRHQLFPMLRARAFESFDLREFDIVLSSCHAEAKGVLTPPDTLHASYIHTPVRYYWSDYHVYHANPGFGRLDPLVRAAMPSMVGRMRLWDFAAAQRPDVLFANSRFVADRIAKYYRRSAQVINPPVDVDRIRLGTGPRDGFLVVARLIPYKRVEIAVAACAELDLPLTVVGTGSELPRLKAMAGRRTRFVMDADDAAVAELYATARAFLFTSEEDFGITPLEAMAAGTPVLALGRGGALETVVAGTTGAFFAEQTTASLVAALREFDPESYDPKVLRRHAEKFRTEAFIDEIRSAVELEYAAFKARGTG